MVGNGTIALSFVDQLRAINDASPPLLDTVVEYLADGNEHLAERLSSQPGWVIDAALRSNRGGVFAAHLSRLDSYELPALKLGKKTEQLLDEAAKLHKQIDRYAYGAPAVRFSEQDVDQARAAGVLIEFENAAPVITDRALYRELCKQAIKRSTEELREKGRGRRAGTQGSQGRRQNRDRPRGAGPPRARPGAARVGGAGARPEPRSRVGATQRARER